MHFNDQQVDLVGDRFDLTLRIANLVDSSSLARQLCRVRILLVGSPEYFQHHGRPRHPADLAQHKALQYSYQSSGTHWRFRHPRHGEFTQAMTVRMQANNAEALTPALLAGLGVALQPAFLARQELQAGTLEAVMEDWLVDPIALHILTPPGRNRPARVQALIEHLARSFSPTSPGPAWRSWWNKAAPAASLGRRGPACPRPPALPRHTSRPPPPMIYDAQHFLQLQPRGAQLMQGLGVKTYAARAFLRHPDGQSDQLFVPGADRTFGHRCLRELRKPFITSLCDLRKGPSAALISRTKCSCSKVLTSNPRK